MFTLDLKNGNLSDKEFSCLESVLRRHAEKRGGRLGKADDAYRITVSVVPYSDEEKDRKDSFLVSPDGNYGAQISANNLCTLYAGLGRFLISSSFDFCGGFEPAALPISHEQKCRIRGMYLATHFYNFWHIAPMDEVRPYIEDLALWGCNSLMLCLAPQHYTSFKSPDAVKMAERLKELFACAGEMGIDPALILFSNTGYIDRPEEIAAPWDMRGEYITPNYAELHREICPNLPGGMDEIRRVHREFFEAFSDVPIKYFAYWPYDEGGCTCDACSRWSENGAVKVYEESVKPLIKEYFPDAEMILSTWHFDRHLRDEGLRLYNNVAAGKYPWAKYILAVHGDGQLMPLVLKNGAPDDRSVIDFPEISMWSCRPWGGYGANPIPMRLDNFFSAAGDALDGGFPYSEGMWENLNEFFCVSHYSGAYESTTDALRDYIRYYFGIKDTEKLVRAIQLMEATLWRKTELAPDGRLRVTPYVPAAIREIYKIITEIDATLPEAVKKDARWRIIYLRAVIDFEISTHENIPLNSARAQSCFRELWDIYHAYDMRIQKSVCPPLGR